MFGKLNETEERIEKIAYDALEISKNHKKDFNTAVSDVASKYHLNNHEIERVCSRVNHIHFGESFRNEKTATFKIAKYEEVIAMKGQNSEPSLSAVHEFDTKVDKSIRSREDHSEVKIASEAEYFNSGDIAEHVFSKMKLAEIETMGLDNAENINIQNAKRNTLLSDIENHIIELVKSGESRESVEAMLIEVCGEENAEEVKAYLDKVFSEINQGYQNLEVKTASQKAYYKDSKLCSLMNNYLDTMDKIAEYETAHHIICHSLLYNGQEKRAMRIDDRVRSFYTINRYLADNAEAISKMAADPNPPTTNQKTEADATKPKPVRFTDKLKSGVAPGLAMAGIPVATGLAVHGISSLVTSARKQKMKGELLKRFPELQNISRENYENIYDSLVGLEPTLLKAPYALAEMIKKHDQYGTIDSSTTMNLLSSGRNDRFGPNVFRSFSDKPIMEGTKAMISGGRS